MTLSAASIRFLVVGVGHDPCVTGHARHDFGGSKQHAQLRDHPPSRRPLWVYDDEDWTFMRAQPSGTLVCPVASCRAPFTRPVENAHGTRFLRDRAGVCKHASARPEGGGGPMSARHRWLEARIARICESMSIKAVCEDFATHADVFLPDVGLCIEVQLRTTDFRRRTLDRLATGHSVLWLLPDDVRGRGISEALFELPSARLLVHARGDSTRRLEPWHRPEEASEAVLSVYATVARLAPGGDVLVTGHHDAARFIREVAAGERRWHKPGTRGLPRPGEGAWVRIDDLSSVLRGLDDRQRAAMTEAARQAASPPSASPLSTESGTEAPVPYEIAPALGEPENAGGAVLTNASSAGDAPTHSDLVPGDGEQASSSAPAPPISWWRSRWRVFVTWYLKQP
jgi:hypothetical protein